MTSLPVAAVPPDSVRAVEVEGEEYVVWRGASGRLGSAPRRCPHLDWDLAEGRVVDDDLVCAAHGWAFDCSGNAYKRTERGRRDDKGTIDRVRVREAGGEIRLG